MPEILPPPVKKQTTCYHCGESCNHSITVEDKAFCCEGCKFVYQLLNENGLCNYYDLSEQPGISAKGKYRNQQFAYLDHEEVQRQLIRFSDGIQSRVLFHLPTMHCASCVWLLENLHRIEPGILHSQTNFQRKEITLVFEPGKVSLRKVVELLAFVGYEPYISLGDANGKKQKKVNRAQIYKIGVAGFAFSNIMMMSFPEYFSGGDISETTLRSVFSWVNLGLSLPVFFYSASEFFISAWKGLRQKWLNIDAPIALAILVTFGRSVYEIVSQSGPGYLDSMSGIVFFMLVGRWFQNKTYDSFSFDRDYKSYFPLGVTRLQAGGEENIPVTLLQKGDRILVRNEEMVPADGLVVDGDAAVDYSFVSGENTPLQKHKGELIYAGGKITGTAVELEVVTPVSQSYITQLWNNDVFLNQKNRDKSFVHPWSRYFTAVLFVIAGSTALYWSLHDSTKILPAVTATLIVACPCFLLLAASFSYGNMLRLFGKNRFYLKNAGVIEAMGRIRSIVLDKTGTLTHNRSSLVQYEGTPLNAGEEQLVRSVTRQSSHPLSQLIYQALDSTRETPLSLDRFEEISGQGLLATAGGNEIRIGSAAFAGAGNPALVSYDTGTHVHVWINGSPKGKFSVSNHYREGIPEMAEQLRQQHYQLHVLSGDNDTEQTNLRRIFGTETRLRFRQSPQDKLDYIATLQQDHQQVLMLGDGLNDAGALRQSQVGVAVTDNTNQFSPACDAILHGEEVGRLHRFLQFARSGKRNISIIFGISIVYNIVGLWFATQALLSPMIAAILMPSSTISIVLLSTLFSNVSARKRGL
ncbi:MAG TPA: heavy metal translocating P-type ATPase metal-binding domain-containing protein [Lacibacter sp.]|nr:heavy metal translocating P-type ATPase metal-binding domain-containing protein [Lacibacter sp.]HMO88244.1 heavy metal translocating P-type ATPase metal-binding domain-containing protein [Lacibacter sp.]HMP86153.1 heavy metal translocating P-type ATPase metal-binding domain-containing protein [Lacibacter sp.]